MEPADESHHKRSSSGTDQHQDQLSLNGMEILPRDISLDIISRLPVTSILHFRCVCRAWNAMAQDPLLKTMHLARAAENYPYPILHCDYPIRNQLYYLDMDAIYNGLSNAVRKINTPFRSDMPEFDVVGSCNGLLCLSDSLYRDTIFIFNPFTEDYMELPKAIRYTDQEVAFGFGFHRITKQYKVVRIVYYRNEYRDGISRIIRLKSEVQVLTVGTDCWRNIGRAPLRLDKVASQALVNGNLHWLMLRRRSRTVFSRSIVSFDLAAEEFKEVKLPSSGDLDYSEFSLAVLGGCLSATVCRSDGQVDVWVMKEYNVMESWMKEFVIGEHIPAGLNEDVCGPSWVKKKAFNVNGPVRVICLLKNNKILLVYKNMALLSYDTEKDEFEDLTIQGLPKWFVTVFHEGSLISISDTLRM